MAVCVFSCRIKFIHVSLIETPHSGIMLEINIRGLILKKLVIWQSSTTDDAYDIGCNSYVFVKAQAKCRKIENERSFTKCRTFLSS